MQLITDPGIRGASNEGTPNTELAPSQIWYFPSTDSQWDQMREIFHKYNSRSSQGGIRFCWSTQLSLISKTMKEGRNLFSGVWFSLGLSSPWSDWSLGTRSLRCCRSSQTWIPSWLSFSGQNLPHWGSGSTWSPSSWSWCCGQTSGSGRRSGCSLGRRR